MIETATPSLPPPPMNIQFLNETSRAGRRIKAVSKLIHSQTFSTHAYRMHALSLPPHLCLSFLTTASRHPSTQIKPLSTSRSTYNHLRLPHLCHRPHIIHLPHVPIPSLNTCVYSVPQLLYYSRSHSNPFVIGPVSGRQLQPCTSNISPRKHLTFFSHPLKSRLLRAQLGQLPLIQPSLCLHPQRSAAHHTLLYTQHFTPFVHLRLYLCFH